MTRHEPVLELKPPVDCSKEERDHFRSIVLEAGEVEETGLDNRIARAEALAFLRLGTAIVGVGALKIPSKEYARKLFKRANAKSEGSAFGLEIGWIVVERAPWEVFSRGGSWRLWSLARADEGFMLLR